MIAHSNTRRPPARRPLSARSADKLRLYELSVQSPAEDTQFFARLYRRMTGLPLRRFREDFCGTALLACQHVANHRNNSALAVDLHGPTLAWGRRQNVEALAPRQQARIELRQADVREVTAPAVELTAALNFSYSVFMTRADLRSYLTAAHRGLVRGGILLLDAWGGSDVQTETEEKRTIREQGYRFTYVWDQASFDPVTHHAVCKIHFRFGDGTELRNAFVYRWRLWTLPELRELMAEVGFDDVHVLWEGTDRATNEGNGVYRRVARGSADPSWIAYVVGRKP